MVVLDGLRFPFGLEKLPVNCWLLPPVVCGLFGVGLIFPGVQFP